MMTITVSIDGKETVYTFPDTDVLALKNDLLDIPDWVYKAVRGKAHNCKERMCDREWLPKLRADPTVTSLPVSQDDMVALIVARADYKDRATREAEAQAALEAERAALTATQEQEK